jgi:hypothetical protein
MATLPDSTALGERPTPQAISSVATYNVQDTSAAGRQLAAAGSQLSQASDIILSTNKRYDELAAEDAYNKLQEQGTTLQYDPNAGFKNVQGSGAIGQTFYKDYTERFSGAAKSLSEGLENDQQRQMFNKRAQIAALQYRSALLQHQAHQTEVFATNTEDNTVKVELRNMAANPTSDEIFQTGLARINGVLDAKGSRLGLPPAETEALKGQRLDAAWSTRILSVANGIPGVVNSNPYAAEKMFIEHQQELGPEAQVQLASHIQSQVKTVQQRDIAQQLIYGGRKPTDPQAILPAIAGAPPLTGVVIKIEGGTDKSGNSLTSPKGAKGEMQVMPGTSADPGFGVAPAKDNSPEELARVGRDYLGAMTARYSDPVLILAAYNAGPGQVDKWIAKYGDPRAGNISSADWAAKIPFSETSKYVAKGMKLINASNGQPDAPISPPTAKELKTQLPALMDRARETAQRMYPNDPVFADGVAARVANYGNQIITAQTVQQQAAQDMLTRGLVGTKPDGSDKAQTMDQLLADPRMKSAWDQATPEVQLSIQSRMARGDNKLTQEGLNRYNELHGLAVNDPEKFKNVDFTKEFGVMPDHLVLDMIKIRDSMTKDQAKQQSRDLNWQRAQGDVESMLRPLGLGKTAKKESTQSKDTDIFYGKLSQAMQTYHDDPKNNKWPDTITIQKMAASLLTPGQQVNKYLPWDSATPAFKSDDVSKFYVPVPSDKKAQYTAAVAKTLGRQPTDAEVQAAYTRYRMAGGK